MKRYCPRYLMTDSSLSIEEDHPDENKKIIKVVNNYEKMICDEKCALYEFKPKCIIGDK
jgi:hypothetical protein